MCSRFADKRKKCKQISLYLPDHVSITSSGVFYFRYVFPAPLRIWLRKRELKASLGRDYGSALQQGLQYNKFVQILKLSWQRSGAVIGVDDNERREIARKIALNMMFGVNDIGNFYDPSMVVWMSQQSALSLSQNFQNTWAMLLQDADPADIQRGGITPALLDHMKQQLQSQAAPAKFLGKVIDEWIEDKERAGISDKTKNAHNMIRNELCWAFGEKRDLASLTSDEIETYRRFWQMDVPLLTYRKTSKLSVRAVISGDYDKPESYLGDKSKINRLLYIRNFFRWCYRHGYLSVDYSQILTEMGFRSRRKAKPSLDDEMIVALYNEALQYKNKIAENSLGDLRYRYWVLLLLLYSGARVGEICQLSVEDVFLPGTVDEVDLKKRRVCCPCICIRPDETKKQFVKNESSIRTIPIHSKVLQAGFLDYVKTRQDAGAIMLFDVSYTQGNGYAGKVSEYYNEFIRKKYPGTKARISSTRHNVETQFDSLQGGTLKYKIALQIMGRTYSEENMVRQSYVDPYPTEMSQPLIETISYPCLDSLLLNN